MYVPKQNNKSIIFLGTFFLIGNTKSTERKEEKKAGEAGV